MTKVFIINVDNFLFQLVPMSKIYANLSPQNSLLGRKKSQKLNIFEFEFFSSKIIFLSQCEALIRSIWICAMKVIELFILQAAIASPNENNLKNTFLN